MARKPRSQVGACLPKVGLIRVAQKGLNWSRQTFPPAGRGGFRRDDLGVRGNPGMVCCHACAGHVGCAGPLGHAGRVADADADAAPGAGHGPRNRETGAEEVK
jgi:hypothetical protein